jgi:hypothetical protein
VLEAVSGPWSLVRVPVLAQVVAVSLLPPLLLFLLLLV